MAEHSLYAQGVNERWRQHARATAPSIWTELEEAKFVVPTLFDAISFLDRFQLVEELEAIVRRVTSGEEQLQFLKLVEESKTFALQRRRVTVDALRQGLVLPVPALLPVYTGRELHAMGKMQPPTSAYPVASGKKTRTKDEERKLVVLKIGEIILRGNFPAASLVHSSAAPDRILGRFGAGKRLGTLKAKLRMYLSMEKWMTAVHNKSFPTELVELTDYLLDRASEPCGPTVPRSITAAVSFWEEIGGVKMTRRIGNDDAIISIVNELKLELSSNVPKCRKTANQYLIAFIISWEVSVCDETVYETQRVRIWVKLVKVWCAFRTSDLSGIPPKLMGFNGQELTGVIQITKTTGSGKRVGQLSFALTSKAWLLMPDWLAVGWELFRKTIDDRDFLLPLPTKDYQTFSAKEPGYSQWLNADRKLLAETFHVKDDPDEDDMGLKIWETSGKPLLICGCQVFWSGHSDRSTLPTWAASLGISKDRIDNVGRWNPGDSIDYVRTSRALAMGVQEEVAEKIRKAGASDPCLENSVFKDLAKFCTERGVEQDTIEEMIQGLRDCREIGGISVPVIIDPDPIPVVPTQYEVDTSVPSGGWVRLSAGKRVVSLDRSSERPMTLHIVGSCYRTPGLHYSKFTVLDDTERGVYQSLCKECFPKDKDPLDVNLVSSESESESSSDDSESSA